jgi:hypothetical protein
LALVCRVAGRRHLQSLLLGQLHARAVLLCEHRFDPLVPLVKLDLLLLTLVPHFYLAVRAPELAVHILDQQLVTHIGKAEELLHIAWLVGIEHHRCVQRVLGFDRWLLLNNLRDADSRDTSALNIRKFVVGRESQSNLRKALRRPILVVELDSLAARLVAVSKVVRLVNAN